MGEDLRGRLLPPHPARAHGGDPLPPRRHPGPAHRLERCHPHPRDERASSSSTPSWAASRPVIWTDVLQSVVLVGGALVCVVVLFLGMPEGPGQALGDRGPPRQARSRELRSEPRGADLLGGPPLRASSSTSRTSGSTRPTSSATPRPEARRRPPAASGSAPCSTSRSPRRSSSSGRCSSRTTRRGRSCFPRGSRPTGSSRTSWPPPCRRASGGWSSPASSRPRSRPSPARSTARRPSFSATSTGATSGPPRASRSRCGSCARPPWSWGWPGPRRRWR